MKTHSCSLLAFASLLVAACHPSAEAPTDAAPDTSSALDASLHDAALDDAASVMDAALDAPSSDAAMDDASMDDAGAGGWVLPTDPCALSFYAPGATSSDASPRSTLAPILAACPTIRTHIAWQDGSGVITSYDDWSSEQKARLEELYVALVRGDEDLGLACPNVSTRTYFAGGTRPRATFLSAEEAFDVFAAHVAHAFYVEASRSVDWSLSTWVGAELDELLSSDRYYATIPVLPSDAYAMGYGVWNGLVTPGVDFQLAPRTFAAPSVLCDPRDGLRFLSGVNATLADSLVRGTARATLEQITLWLSENVIHGDCSGDDCLLPEYQFFLRDRLNRSARYGRITAPQGCHSAQNLVYDLARSVNIPLRAGSMRQTLNDASYFFYTNHGALVFDFARANPLILQHLDDAYAMEITPAILPRAGAGALTRDEIAAQVFEALWSSVDTLESFNFEVPENFPLVHPGDRYGAMPSLYEEYADFGAMAGVWMPLVDHEPLDGTPGTVGAWFPAGTGLYRLHQESILCGARLVRDYCANELAGEGSFATQMNSMYPGLAYAESYDTVVTTDALWDRAAECVAAVGGCEAAETLRAEIEANYGVRTWMD